VERDPCVRVLDREPLDDRADAVSFRAYTPTRFADVALGHPAKLAKFGLTTRLK
jgi:hypothetical protein